MRKLVKYGIIGCSVLIAIIVCGYLYNEGAPIGVSAIVPGSLDFDQNGKLVVTPDQPIPQSQIHIAWSKTYIFEQQFRHAIDTLGSMALPLTAFIGTAAGAIVAVNQALPIIRKALKP